MAYRVLFIVLLLLTVFIYISGVRVRAQDTFGPICDDVTVTCVPTESPTPETEAPTPTDEPTETPEPPPPTELPRAGTTDNVNRLVLAALTLIVAGGFTRFAFVSGRK